MATTDKHTNELFLSEENFIRQRDGLRGNEGPVFFLVGNEIVTFEISKHETYAMFMGDNSLWQYAE